MVEWQNEDGMAVTKIELRARNRRDCGSKLRPLIGCKGLQKGVCLELNSGMDRIGSEWMSLGWDCNWKREVNPPNPLCKGGWVARLHTHNDNNVRGMMGWIRIEKKDSGMEFKSKRQVWPPDPLCRGGWKARLNADNDKNERGMMGWVRIERNDPGMMEWCMNASRWGWMTPGWWNDF